MLGDGSMPGSLGYLKHAGCHLSRTLCEIGRPKEDSPALTVTVQTYSEGYRSSVQLGYMEAGAVYWDHMVIPVHTRDGVIGETSYCASCAVMCAALHRDVCMVLYIWKNIVVRGLLEAETGDKRLLAPHCGVGARVASHCGRYFVSHGQGACRAPV